MKILTTFIAMVIVSMAIAQDSQRFTLEELYQQATEDEKRYLNFFDNEKLSSGIYQLRVGDEDGQQPHAWDELYYVQEGKGELKVGDRVLKVEKGDILFVPANATHQFINISEDLKLLVFFSKKD